MLWKKDKNMSSLEQFILAWAASVPKDMKELSEASQEPIQDKVNRWLKEFEDGKLKRVTTARLRSKTVPSLKGSGHF